MRRVWPLPALAAMLLAGVVPATGQALEAHDIRIGVHAGSTRFVVDLSDAAEPRVFGLPEPYRVVIDLPETGFERIGAGASGSTEAGDGGGLIDKYRFGLFRPGTSRIVLDLNRPATVARQFLLRPDQGKPWRLVIDLAPTDHGDFIIAMRPSVGAQPPAGSESPPLRTETLPLAGRKPVIAIDPGHGGVDPGAIGKGGVYEKNLVLDYARNLRRALLATGRYDVVLTRDRDIFLPLRERVRLARQSEADLFLSLHVNSHPKSTSRGFSVYTLSERASDKEAAALAAHENKADIIGGMDLGEYSDDVQNILIDFAQTKTNEMSVRFARDMMVPAVSDSAPLLSRPWRSAGFAVLKAPDVPSVLIELGYISNRDEARQLGSGAHRTRIVDSIVRSIDRYFDTTQRAGLN
ncbi:MAG: N-acetylmuramoyl-L-alanine amidase [Alphaproteobacteria bacterium]